MDTFAAYKFGTLLGVELYTNYTEAPTIYYTGWDNNRDVSVCIAVVNKTTPEEITQEYELAWSWTYDRNFQLDRNDQWIVGLAYVECSGAFEPLEFPDDELDPVQLTADEYQAIMEAAR